MYNPEENNKEKKQRNITIIVVAFSFFCSAVFALAIIYHHLHSQIEKNEEYISSLIDEVGLLKQEIDNVRQDPKVISKVARASTVFAGDFKNNFELLILGTNGAHTDTIMIASVNEDLETVSLFSIPRDLYIKGRRINEYYTYYGIEELKRILKDLTGLEIEKYVQVDLQGFIDIVDSIGGLDIYVDNAIYDSYYPGWTKGTYKPYSIEVGDHHMDGEEALKYARSRYSTSDFDRSARQQKVLYALKEKFMSLHSLEDLKSVSDALKAGMEHTTTDMNSFDVITYFYGFKDFTIESGLVISNQNYLYSSINENGAYMLLPNKGSFKEIQSVIADLVYN